MHFVLDYRQSFPSPNFTAVSSPSSVSPAIPPHELNFEYDLLSNHLIAGGKALGITAEQMPFTDVAPDAYYTDTVVWAVANKITGGVGSDRFAPDGSCTRAQIVTFLWRAAGSPVVNYAMSFSDVAEGEWYAEAVRWAASEGVTTGLPDGTFGVTDTCTRAQVVTFLWRAAGSPVVNYAMSFSDVAEGEWYAEAVRWAASEGVTTGLPDGTFGVTDTCTRAQVVTMLCRALAA